MCSTPNGIKGTYTCLTWGLFPLRRGAQRLTASKEPTPGRRYVIENVAGKCSTPNGIKGTYTATTPGGSPVAEGCSTPNGIKGTYTASSESGQLSGIVVLNA